MVKNINNTREAPIVLGFTPINKPVAGSHNHKSVELNKDVVLDEPPRKRRKKGKNGDLQTLPKSAQPRKKATTEKRGSTKTRPSPEITTLVSSQLSTATVVGNAGVLAEKTKSKLNSFRYGAIPTPASTTELSKQDQENIPPVAREQRHVFEARPDEDGESDSTLSSDLWKNQQPLSDYPWLQSLGYRHKISPKRAVAASDRRSESPVLLAQFLQPDAITHFGQTHNMMDEDELDGLLDGIIDDSFDIVETEEPVSEGLPRTLKVSDQGFDLLDGDNYTLGDDDLDVLFETTCLNDLSAKRTDIADSVASVDVATHQQMSSLPKQAVEPLIDPPVLKEYFDIDEHELEDMIDLFDAIPQTLKRDRSQPENTTYYRSSSKAPITSPIVTIYSIEESPQRSTQLKEGSYNRFARPPFPPVLQTPSPMQGLCPEDRVLTCFRIGEAINATARAQKEGNKIFIELYARVLHSVRAGPVQTFRIIDLWSSPNKLGLELDGRWVGWEKSELWRKDGNIFWEDGLLWTKSSLAEQTTCHARKCRLIGSLERKAAGGYLVNILNLWEAAWDDVDFAKSLVCEPSDSE